MSKPTVVCLCGSTRFSEAFQKANLAETLAGRIVLTIGCDMRSDAELFADKSALELDEIKQQLDLLHLRKIDLADEVLILNVDGYVGESTKREWEYAVKSGKRVRWLEPARKLLPDGWTVDGELDAFEQYMHMLGIPALLVELANGEWYTIDDDDNEVDPSLPPVTLDELKSRFKTNWRMKS